MIQSGSKPYRLKIRKFPTFVKTFTNLGAPRLKSVWNILLGYLFSYSLIKEKTATKRSFNLFPQQETISEVIRKEFGIESTTSVYSTSSWSIQGTKPDCIVVDEAIDKDLESSSLSPGPILTTSSLKEMTKKVDSLEWAKAFFSGQVTSGVMTTSAALEAFLHMDPDKATEIGKIEEVEDL